MPRNHTTALEYHAESPPGKLSIRATKPLANQRDLALAYSPGVADACNAIVEDPSTAAKYTIRGNLVAVVTNGTAVLGLGNIGPLAAKPVMEGKAVLFKKFADVDVFDLEINEPDPHKFADIVAALEPSFGAINLEDIKAPDCFIVEDTLRERMNIPVFHDDQHGTAIVVGSAVRNGLHVIGKKIEEVKIVSTGGGAAGIACLKLLESMGAKRENITLVDHLGVIYKGRTEDMTPQKAEFAVETDQRTLADAMPGADVFLGLSAPGILKPEAVATMAERPLILALANPKPEILPEDALAARPDAVMATGRSDYPNQVNNVLCFPFIFRGALDVGATTINEEMKLACVEAIAALARREATDIVQSAYGGDAIRFGPEYLIPKPFDPRLLEIVAPAVAKAAMESGVATRPIEDLGLYQEKLSRHVYRSGMLMKPVFERARQSPRRVVFAEGEDERILRTAQVLLDEKLAVPILIGRPQVIENRCEKLGLRIRPEKDFEICNPEYDTRYNDYWTLYHQLMERRGVSPEEARTVIRTNTTVIAALMVRRGEADAMICGSVSRYTWQLRHVTGVLCDPDQTNCQAALSGVITGAGTVFITDTYVNPDPTAEQLVCITQMAAEAIERLGLTPKVAMISHSTFGSSDWPSAVKMREATAELQRLHPDMEIEGEMHADAALDEKLRERLFPNSRLKDQANLLVMANLDAANSAVNLLRSLGEGLRVGPILLGVPYPAHIATPSVTTRGLVNLSALAVVDAQARNRGDAD